MLKPLKIPRGVADIFIIGDASSQKIDETTTHRPDRVLEQFGMESIGKEITNNYLTNVSPISCKNGIDYIIADSLFCAYFIKQ